MLTRLLVASMLSLVCTLFDASADEYLRQTVLTTAEVGLQAKFGQERGSFTEPGDLISEQLMAMISGPPDPIVQIRPDVYMFSACRQGSCKERGIVIVDIARHGLLIGAWRHFHCRRQEGQGRCDVSPSVSVVEFSGLKEKSDQAHLRLLVEQWADRNRTLTTP